MDHPWSLLTTIDELIAHIAATLEADERNPDPLVRDAARRVRAEPTDPGSKQYIMDRIREIGNPQYAVEPPLGGDREDAS